MHNRPLLQNISWNKVLLIAVLFILQISILFALPTGPTITLVTNSTRSPTSAALVNTTGGSITTMVLNVTAQNLKWKAYIGNVSGSLVLDDADGYSIFDWSLSEVVGEVYVTRNSSAVSWENVGCANETHLENENIALNHTSNGDDNISKTFNETTHGSFYVGTVEVPANNCFALHTFVNNQSQTTSFEEVVLYDGTTLDDGGLVYATPLEQNAQGYNTQNFDFQMIVPEVALSSWDSSTGYYFYVELI